MPHSIDFRILNRPGSSKEGATRQARTSVDFSIDGEGLLEMLTKVDGGHGDFMGCFVQGFEKSNQAKLELLLSSDTAETEEGRVLLYVCPECGDIACGSYAARVKVTKERVEWYDFAYENGYEPAKPLTDVGPFEFSAKEYTSVVRAASAA